MLTADTPSQPDSRSPGEAGPRPLAAPAYQEPSLRQGARQVEHVFRVLKCQFGYRKVRYRGIAKNGAQVFALLALANLYLARGRLVSA